jgi:hypothetical protein
MDTAERVQLLEQRINSLEASGRRQRRLTSTLALLIIALCTIGAARQANDKLEVRRLTVRNPAGGGQIVLTVEGSAGPRIALFNPANKLRAMLNTNDAGIARLNLFGATTKANLQASASDDLGTALSIRDRDDNLIFTAPPIEKR